MQTPAVAGKRSAARVASAAPRLCPLNQTVRDAASGVSLSTSAVQTRSSASRNPSWTAPCVARTSRKRVSSNTSPSRSGSVPRNETMTAPGIDAM